MFLDDTRMAGSCEWFTSKEDFTNWQSTCADSPPLIWLSGNAATGKSVLASHVIRRLESETLPCSYFFFKHNSAGKSSVADCLRSLAFQMACSDESARSKLLSLEKDDSLWERGDERVVWRKLFLRCLFLTGSSQPHFWVIDALDECSNFQSLFPLFSRIPKNIRIFISSRSTQDIEQGFTGLGELVLHQHICVSDTIEDIRLFITSKMDGFPIGYDENRKILQDRIVTKSAGSFLWVRLVVQELEHTFSEEAIEDVLNEVPPDMNQLYARILTNMTKEIRGTNLAKAILMWSVCVSRPLSIHELQYALKLDINETVHNLERSIASICGQLIFVDHCSKVQIIHQTARDFLLQQLQIPQFSIQKKQSHARLASVCLQFLTGDWFKSQHFQGQKSTPGFYAGASLLKQGRPDDSRLKSAFADYACRFFSDHLYKSSSQDSSSLGTLCSFLNKNVLSWIEHIARTGDLSYLTLAAKNMKAFLERRTKYFPPISREVETVEAWVTDLIRVTAKFRTNLLASPSSIYSLIPPICPSDSIIARTYSARQRGLVVKGLKAQAWDDCLARIDFHGAQTTTVAHGEQLFAVGLSNGKIHLYDSVSLQENGISDHGERVKILRFSNEDKLLVSSGLGHIRLWNSITCSQIWSLTTSYQTMALMFTADDGLINIACRDNCIRTIKAFDGVEINCGDLIENGHDDFLGRRTGQSPSLAVFSNDCNMLAVSHRGRPILVFDIENDNLPLSYSREGPISPLGPITHYTVDAMVFNPSPEINVLIVSYGDGELTVYDLWSAEPKHRLYEIFAHSLICSPDGRSLVTGSSRGTIQIFDFGGVSGDKLSLIYQIDAHEDGIKALSFSQDSLRFIDIRASQCRIWEPAVLIRRDFDEGSYSELSQPFPGFSKRNSVIESSSASEITSICCHMNGKTVFCGRQDGAILCYRTVDGGNEGILYSHAINIGIVALALASAQDLKLISADESGRLIIKKISNEQGHWSESETIADIRFNESIATLLINPILGRVLVIGGNIDVLLDLQGNQICKRESIESRAAIYHPLHPEFFIMLQPRLARIFEWANFEEVTSQEGIRLERLDESSCTSGAALVPIQDSSLIEIRKVLGKRTSSLLDFWQSSEFEANSKVATSIGRFEKIEPRIEYIIDVLGTVLYFLDVDLWICSVDLRTFSATQQVKRHFFIPSDWRNNIGRLLMRLTSKRDFVFGKRDEFVVVKRGLEFSEIMEISDLLAEKKLHSENYEY
jgi:WD40 repeat protein